MPLLLQALAAVHAEHPQLVFEVDANQGLVNVVQREADIAIRMAPLNQPSLMVTRLGPCRGAFLLRLPTSNASHGAEHGRAMT